MSLCCNCHAKTALGGLCGAVVKGQTKGQMIVAADAVAVTTCGKNCT